MIQLVLYIFKIKLLILKILEIYQYPLNTTTIFGKSQSSNNYRYNTKLEKPIFVSLIITINITIRTFYKYLV